MIEKQLTKSCKALWMSVLWTCFGIAILLGLLGWFISLILGVAIHALLFIPFGIFIIGLLSHWYTVVYWQRFLFAYDDSQIRINNGIWWRKQVLIPFTRITNIDIMQGPWQRRRQQATLKIQTAGQGASTQAESQLWSQENFEALREDLLNRIVLVRSQVTGDGTSDDLSPESEDTTWRRVIEILTRIEENTRPHDRT